jgi:tight adherence protein B
MLWILSAVTTFLMLASLYLALGERNAARSRVTVARVGRLIGDGASPEVVESILRESESDLGSLLSGAAKRYKLLRTLELMLYRAGQPMTLARLLGLTVGLTLGGAALGSLLGFGPLPALLGAGPVLFVRRAKNKRMKAFDDGFPAALGLFSRALRAGHSMNSALQTVGSELPDPVGPEFALVAREISLGLAPATALMNLQARMEAHDLPVFVTAVLVQLETGGNLAETLDNLAEVIRARMLFHGKVKALTAQSMMSANILVVVPFAIFLMMRFMNPKFLEPMLSTEIGRMLIGLAGVLTVGGWYVCRRVARVDA